MHRQARSLRRVHLLKAQLIAVLNEPENDAKYRSDAPQQKYVHDAKHSLLLDNVQTLVYAGPGPLYAAHLVISLLGVLMLSHIFPFLCFPTLLWFRPLRLLWKGRFQGWQED